MKIYAGRYEVHTPKKIDLFEEIEKGNIKPKSNDELQQFQPPYKVTFSEEGLANAKALREYANEHGLPGQIDYDAQWDELNTLLHTRSMDMSQVFITEMEQIAEEIRAENHLSNTAPNIQERMAVMSKAYDTVLQRIEDEFNNPDRETTYILQSDGTRRVETKEDRIQELYKAYEKYADIQGSVMQGRLHYIQAISGQHRNISEDELRENTKTAFLDAVSAENRQKIRNHVSGSSLSFSVDSSWLSLMNTLRNSSIYVSGRI